MRVVVNVSGVEIAVEFSMVEEEVALDAEEGEEGFVGKTVSFEEFPDGGGRDEV